MPAPTTTTNLRSAVAVAPAAPGCGADYRILSTKTAARADWARAPPAPALWAAASPQFASLLVSSDGGGSPPRHKWPDVLRQDRCLSPGRSGPKRFRAGRG